MLSILRHRVYRHLFVAQVISLPDMQGGSGHDNRN
jgi:hypothetical protein